MQPEKVAEGIVAAGGGRAGSASLARQEAQVRGEHLRHVERGDREGEASVRSAEDRATRLEEVCELPQPEHAHTCDGRKPLSGGRRARGQVSTHTLAAPGLRLSRARWPKALREAIRRGQEGLRRAPSATHLASSSTALSQHSLA